MGHGCVNFGCVIITTLEHKPREMIRQNGENWVVGAHKNVLTCHFGFSSPDSGLHSQALCPQTKL